MDLHTSELLEMKLHLTLPRWALNYHTIKYITTKNILKKTVKIVRTINKKCCKQNIDKHKYRLGTKIKKSVDRQCVAIDRRVCTQKLRVHRCVCTILFLLFIE